MVPRQVRQPARQRCAVEGIAVEHRSCNDVSPDLAHLTIYKPQNHPLTHHPSWQNANGKKVCLEDGDNHKVTRCMAPWLAFVRDQCKADVDGISRVGGRVKIPNVNTHLTYPWTTEVVQGERWMWFGWTHSGTACDFRGYPLRAKYVESRCEEQAEAEM